MTTAQACDQVDLDAFTAELRTVVAEPMRRARVSLSTRERVR